MGWKMYFEVAISYHSVIRFFSAIPVSLCENSENDRVFLEIGSENLIINYQ